MKRKPPPPVATLVKRDGMSSALSPVPCLSPLQARGVRQGEDGLRADPGHFWDRHDRTADDPRQVRLYSLREARSGLVLLGDWIVVMMVVVVVVVVVLMMMLMVVVDWVMVVVVGVVAMMLMVVVTFVVVMVAVVVMMAMVVVAVVVMMAMVVMLVMMVVGGDDDDDLDAGDCYSAQDEYDRDDLITSIAAIPTIVMMMVLAIMVFMMVTRFIVTALVAVE